jgi:serine protease Do
MKPWIVLLALSGAAAAEEPQAEYADGLAALSPGARTADADPEARYSYCVRSTAVYECLSYDRDANVRRTRVETLAHGTAFGYRRDGDDTLLLTNEHVAEWPSVTDAEHTVEGVPPGCKKIAESDRIVDDDHDDYAPDDVPLQVVVADPQLDVAILRAHAKLHILPWKIGRSASLRERALVEVKGFPLGAFAATSVGKVTSAYNHDDFKDWEHDDFVVDALLSPGNSGSPVLAISTRTGEFELVGIFHAHYSDGNGLNLVIGIDQVRDLMTSLKRAPRPHLSANAPLDRSSREALAAQLQADPAPFFAFGPQVATVAARADGALVFTVYAREFPTKAQPIFVAVDEPGADGDATQYGKVDKVFWGGERGLKAYTRADLDAETQAQLGRVVEGLRRAAAATFSYRAAARETAGSRAAYERAARLERSVRRTAEQQGDLAAQNAELAAHHQPATGEPVILVIDAIRQGNAARRNTPVPQLPNRAGAQAGTALAP